MSRPVKGWQKKAMKGGNRRFVPGAVNHIYQIARKGEVIFYNICDHLVYFSIFCTMAERYGIRVLKLCHMPDHIHGSVIADRKRDLSGFERDLTSLFAREHNGTCHREGPFFKTPFGSVPKVDDKKVRTNLIYVDNNPVERHICERAEQYRWNFLAYATNDHPFSEKFRKEDASKAMLRAIRVVKDRHKAGVHMPYALLRRLFKPLSRKEQLQLTDIIITIYSVIDYPAAARYFGSHEGMLTAIHSTTGSEYEMKERFVGKDDSWYTRMSNIVMAHCGLEDIHDMLTFSKERKSDLFLLLRNETMATAGQIAKFLRIPLRRAIEEKSSGPSSGR